MPRSARTQELYSKAHSLGDEYYRLVSRSIRDGRDVVKECSASANLYMTALKTLREHLDSLEECLEKEGMIESTDSFIKLMDRDIHNYNVGIAPSGPAAKCGVGASYRILTADPKVGTP